MLNKLFRRRQQPDPVRLPPEYHWHRETLAGCCAMCGKDLPNRWPDRWTTMVAWKRPNETEPRAFGPVGVCCAGRLMPWPDEEMVHLALRLECSACGQEMGGNDYGVDSTHFLPWFDFVCDGGRYPEDDVVGCGYRVRMRLPTPTALWLGVNRAAR